MSDEELKKKLPDIGVVARVAPEDKIRLVTMLQQKDNIVAMTGDGVNDAPALKKADIGVAMGITGTEVSKGAAVMILTDDNFATIVKAVEFGRAIYNNLFNFVRFQMESLVAFIISYLLAAFFHRAGGEHRLHTVRGPVDQLPCADPGGLALGFDDPAPDLMEHKPRPLKQPILTPPMGAHCLHRLADVDRHGLLWNAFISGPCGSCGNDGIYCLRAIHCRARPQRSQRDRQRIQPRHSEESATAYALRDFAVDDHLPGPLWLFGDLLDPDHRPTNG
jgi:hypothetical protein